MSSRPPADFVDSSAVLRVYSYLAGTLQDDIRIPFVNAREEFFTAGGDPHDGEIGKRFEVGPAVTRRPQSRVVALTASGDEARMMGVLRAGAAAYVRKDADPETLVAAVRVVAAGKTSIDPDVSRMLSERTAPDDLTQRELDVLREVALGHTNREIALTLGVTDETVKTHVARVLGKLQVENRAQAIVQALKRGLVTLEEIS